jgi:hypothetical protein
VAVDTQRVAAIPRSMNGRYSAERLWRGTPGGHPTNLCALDDALLRKHVATLDGG